jgi:MFS family permease
MGLQLWGLLVPIIPVLLVLHAIAGLVFAPVNPLIDTVLQERVPAEMRARVFGTASAGVLVGIPLGTVVSGYLVAWVGLQLTLEIMGALYLVTALSLLIHPCAGYVGHPFVENVRFCERMSHVASTVQFTQSTPSLYPVRSAPRVHLYPPPDYRPRAMPP